MQSTIRQLYIMRHASAEQGGVYDDFNRGLSPVGVKEIKSKIKKFKSPEGIRPDCILCSTAKRTKQTAEIILSMFKGVPIFYKEALYLAPAHRFMEIIQQTDDIFRRILIIGHNPGVEQITGLVAKKRIFHPATCVVIEVPLNHWKEISLGCGKIQKIF